MDLSKLPPAAQLELMHCHAEMLRTIDAALHHMVVDHNTTPVYQMGEDELVVSGPMCDGGIVLLCGGAVYAKINALQLKAKTIHAEAVAAQAVEKAKNA